MSDEATRFGGGVPENYDRGLGPIFFADYADHTARLVAGYTPLRVLETGAGTGIVTRRLRDLLPATARLIATDLNPPMLEIARKKFRSDEPVEFRQADAMALPFADASFDAMVCQFSAQFFPDKEKSYREAYRVLAPGGRCIQRLGRRPPPWSPRRRSCRPIFPDRSAAILSGGHRLQQNRPD